MDVIRGGEGTFVRDVKVITKQRGTECVTHCGKDVFSSTYIVTVMRRRQDFTKRFLFINKLKGKSVVHDFHENLAISLVWVPLPRKIRGPLWWEWGPQEVRISSRSFTHGLSHRA